MNILLYEIYAQPHSTAREGSIPLPGQFFKMNQDERQASFSACESCEPKRRK